VFRVVSPVIIFAAHLFAFALAVGVLRELIMNLSKDCNARNIRVGTSRAAVLGRVAWAVFSVLKIGLRWAAAESWVAFTDFVAHTGVDKSWGMGNIRCGKLVIATFFGGVARAQSIVSP